MRLATANHCKVINVQKWSGFLAHPVYRCRNYENWLAVDEVIATIKRLTAQSVCTLELT